MRADGITASGLQTFDGACACGSGYEFFTLFYVPSLGRAFVCVDRGNLVGDGNLDIWMEDREEALVFGVQTHRVVVIEVEGGGSAPRIGSFVVSGPEPGGLARGPRFGRR